MVDFLLVLIELFSLAVMAAALLSKICRQLSWLRCYERIFVEIVLFERGSL